MLVPQQGCKICKESLVNETNYYGQLESLWRHFQELLLMK